MPGGRNNRKQHHIMKDILDIDRQELCDWLSENSFPSYRTDQILQWVYQHNVDKFSLMSNLPADLRELLSQQFSLRAASLQRTCHSHDSTVKLLLAWPDETLTETVLISTGSRRTVCISSQVGCPVRCAFCASGLDGLTCSLEAGRMVEQVLWVRKQLDASERISNVVIMGMGEPFANYDNTIKAVKIINADWALEIGARHITISTIGLPRQIRKLAHEPLQVTLAVSLHAPNDQLRSQLIPIAGQIKLEELFQAIDYYYQQTHREVTLEYVLLDGVNCLPVHADQLAGLARQVRCNVNLINYNHVAETDFKPAGNETAQAFKDRLIARGINVHLRRSHGSQIDAACGQLRRRYSHKEK